MTALKCCERIEDLSSTRRVVRRHQDALGRHRYDVRRCLRTSSGLYAVHAADLQHELAKLAGTIPGVAEVSPLDGVRTDEGQHLRALRGRASASVLRPTDASGEDRTLVEPEGGVDRACTPRDPVRRIVRDGRHHADVGGACRNDFFEPSEILDDVVATHVMRGLRTQLEVLAVDLGDERLDEILQLDGRPYAADAHGKVEEDGTTR